MGHPANLHRGKGRQRVGQAPGRHVCQPQANIDDARAHETLNRTGVVATLMRASETLLMLSGHIWCSQLICCTISWKEPAIRADSLPMHSLFDDGRSITLCRSGYWDV